MTDDRHVFINCPFDRDDRPLLRALLFAVYDCGVRARWALEVEDSGEVCVQKILRIIGEAPLGIHDISRVEVIAKRYRAYRATLPTLCQSLQLNPRRLTFTDDVSLLNAWLKENAGGPSA